MIAEKIALVIVFQDPDLTISEYSFPDMQDKPVIYFPSFCRVHVPPQQDESKGPRGDDGAEHFARSKTFKI